MPAHIRDATERKQAMLPRGADMLAPIGTAPGCIVRVGGQRVVVLPGPPHETERMWPAAVGHPALAEVIARAGGPPRLVLRLHGVVESQLVAALDRIPAPVQDGARLGICAKAGEVELTLADVADGGSARLAAAIDAAFPGATFTRTGEPVEAVVGRLLLEQGARLVVAESCTGGLLGSRLTALAGASRWFLGGVIAYDNAVKQSRAGGARARARHRRRGVGSRGAGHGRGGPGAPRRRLGPVGHRRSPDLTVARPTSRSAPSSWAARARTVSRSRPIASAATARSCASARACTRCTCCDGV